MAYFLHKSAGMGAHHHALSPELLNKVEDVTEVLNLSWIRQ